MKTMAEIKRDSKRWDALMGSERLRVLGTAGIGSPDYQHFGVEFYSAYPGYDTTEENKYAIKTFEVYADTIIKGKTDED